jgi:hypothetical protein
MARIITARLPVKTAAKTPRRPTRVIAPEMTPMETDPTTLSPQVLRKRATDSLMASNTPLSSRTRTGTTKMVTRLQIPPTTATAILPRIPLLSPMARRTIPTVAAMMAQRRMDPACRTAWDSPSPRLVSRPWRREWTQVTRAVLKKMATK